MLGQFRLSLPGAGVLIVGVVSGCERPAPPQAGVACDKGRGELVSFPSEELSDWVRFLDGTPQGSREGGFTMTQLQGRYGSPPATAEAWPASKDG